MRVIICGAGQVGFNLATYLSEHDNHVTVIDQSSELINRINDRLDVRALCGFASHPDVLEKAEAGSAEMLIAVTQSDEVNIVACQTAGSLFNVRTKVARIRAQAYLDPRWSRLYSPERINIDLVISPELEVAQSISRSLTVPGAFDIISLSDGKVKIIGVRCTLDTPIVNTPITHLTSLFPQIDICVVGIMRGDQAILPTLTDTLYAGDEVYFAVDKDKVPEAMRAFGHESSDSRRLLILGGGNIGLCLAQEIEKHHPNVHAEIIEKDPARAEFIAGELKNTLVLQGDALDSEVLYEANINVAETVVAVTEDERVNTLASLLSKRLGASRALCLINNTLHAPLVTSLGVDAVISPKKVTVSKILQNIRRGRIRSVHSLGESFGEIIEAEAQESSGLIGSPVSDINSPHEIIVAAIIRQEEVIIPMPSTAIKLEDRIILMVTPAAISKIEKLFSSRLDYY